MKKMLIALVMVLGLLSTSNAFAVALPDIFMTDGNGSYNIKTEFNLSETPWLYLNLPGTGLNVVGSWWQDPSLTYTFEGTDPSTAQEVWLSPATWNTIKETGLWNVDAFYSYASGANGLKSTSFKVVPEPISSALFLLGGGALALRTYRKRTAKKA